MDILTGLIELNIPRDDNMKNKQELKQTLAYCK